MSLPRSWRGPREARDPRTLRRSQRTGRNQLALLSGVDQRELRASSS
jgi:hypothetical protein